MLTLTSAEIGKIYKVSSIEDPVLRRQLTARGFVKGTPVKILKNQGKGPLLVEVKNTRVALGHTEARKVHLKEASAA